MHIGAREPLHHAVEFRRHVVEIEHVGGHRRARRRYLVARHLVAAAVDGVEQRLREVHPGAEELHLLSEAHGGDAAGDAIVVAPVRPHQVVVLVLQGRGVATHLDAVALEGGRQVSRPQDRYVRLGCGTEIGERMQHAVAALGHQRLSVEIHAADAFGRPVRVAAEQGIVVGRTQEAHDAELLDELVPQLLGAGLIQHAILEIAFDVDIEKGRDAADRHGRAVRFLHGPEIGKVGPLDRLMRVRSRPPDVAIVELAHLGEVLQRAHLLGQLLAHPDHLVGRPHVVDLGAFGALCVEQPVHPVERDTTIVADDAAAAVGVGQPGDDPGLAAFHDFGRIGVEHAVVVGLAIFGEGLVDLRIGLDSGSFQARLDHAQAAVREDRALERLVGLQPDDDLVVTIDVARLVRQQGRWRFCIDCEHAFLALFLEIRLKLRPYGLGPLGWADEEFLVAAVGRHVAGDEIADVDGATPMTQSEIAPARFVSGALGQPSRSFHGRAPCGSSR